MPKKVDHVQRRRQIADAVAGIAMTDGLQGVSFREVASVAGMSVSLIQHYFGTKQQLLIGTLDIQSERIAGHILGKLETLGPDVRPLERTRAVAQAFLPDDDERRAAMLLYLGFAGAALTDESLRRAEAFRNATSLLDFIATELTEAAAAGELAEGVDPPTQAQSILSLVLGLSLTVLLEQTSARDASRVLDAHMALLGSG